MVSSLNNRPQQCQALTQDQADWKNNFYKDNLNQNNFTLTDHFKLYNKGRLNESAGKIKRDVAQSSFSEQSEFHGKSLQKLEQQAYGCVKENFGAKEMMVKLDSIQE